MSNIDKFNLNTADLQSIAQDILQASKKLKASQTEVNINMNKGFTVSGHSEEVETVEYHQNKSIDIIVYFGKRMGASSLSDTRPEAIKDAVEAACHIAKFTDEDPAAGLADKSELGFNYPTIELNFPWDISVEKAIELVCECEREAKTFDKRIINAEYCSLATLQAYNLYANSHGFVGAYPTTHHELSCVLIAKDKKDMQREYSYTVGVNPLHLLSVKEVARQAAERTIKRLGARPLPTMKSPVIYLAEEARGILGHFAAAIHGRQVYRQSTFLLDKVGKQIFPEFVHLQEHPHLDYALGSAPFDENGINTRSNVFVENGILQHYALDVYSARKLGLKSTGNGGGLHNLTIKTGNNDLQALLKKMHKGLLITELMGHGVNLLTGDYSRGVGGYWVENGEIQFPVQEVTVAGNLKDIYANIVDIGNDVDLRGNIRTGSILIEEMMIAGAS